MTDIGVGPEVETDAATLPDAGHVPLRVLGVRHHGPGSARAVRRALERQRPDVVLIEGPADADALVEHVPGLQPPVALLGWRKDDPGRAAFWPFAVFSPEWQALDWAAANGVPVRFIDLPTWAVLADDPDAGTPHPDTPYPDATDGDLPEAVDPGQGESGTIDPGTIDPDATGTPVAATPQETAPLETTAEQLRTDPIARLAAAAGYDDPEAWWEDVVELGSHRAGATSRRVSDGNRTGDDRAGGERGAEDPFDVLTEAMAELRAERPETDERTLLREAHMRRELRAARKEFGHVAVVCGAWHAPALGGKLPAASADNALLRTLPTGAVRRSTEMTWVPWTHSRLAQASGYGAGVTAPGWYHHLFTTPDEPVVRWLALVASVLRTHDLPVSSAHIIEATRLAEMLATLRGRPMPGLPEVTEAVWSVMCEGNHPTLDLVTREAVVGEALGEVPDEVPMVPLEADLRATARSLRLRFEALEKPLVLDLRKPNDLARSQLFHRLTILRVPWARPLGTSGKGTFKEGWTLAWEPELSVRIIEAARHGTTVAGAATAVLVARSETLEQVTASIERALVADLGDALPPLLRSLDERAAAEADVEQLLASVPPLTRASRYGDVRRTDTDRLAMVASDVLGRACAGLGAASSGASREVAAQLRTRIDAVQGVVAMLDETAQQLWRDTLQSMLERRDLPGLLAGRLTRLLFDAGFLDTDDVAGRIGRALSRGQEVEWQADWIEGFLSGSQLLLLHEPRLLRVLDAWMARLSDDDFLQTLPVVRRAFGQWDAAARRQLAARVAGFERSRAAGGVATEASGHVAGGQAPGHPVRDDAPSNEASSDDTLFDEAAGVLATVALILGASA